MLVMPATQEGRQKDFKFEVSPRKVNETLSQKQNKNKRTGGLAQVTGHLLST
jgi:hypothetical protein